MVVRKLLWLLALAPWSLSASAAVTIDEAQVANAGGLVVAGQVSPPVRSVTLTIGPVTSVLLTPDWAGRFVWIDQQVPPECVVAVTAGGERVVAGIAGCGRGGPFAVQSAQTTTSTTYAYGSSDARVDQPAAGGGATTQTTTTTGRVLRPTFISPNDPRYAEDEPPHWGEPAAQGTHSAEMLPPSHGFYAKIRNKDAGGD
ncbi:MAG TPA: hypothetical protein VMB81_24160 [Candidatus Sulfotelmatobacter sp.]|nr:hypothetical protein [Candidatus Sulfotelmatobacter sp.]